MIGLFAWCLHRVDGKYWKAGVVHVLVFNSKDRDLAAWRLLSKSEKLGITGGIYWGHDSSAGNLLGTFLAFRGEPGSPMSLAL